MELQDALDHHFALCQEIHSLLMEENRILQGTRRPPDDEFLNRKRTLLPRLDDAMERLHSAWEDSSEPRTSANTIQRNQQKMLALLLLDRENEQLLLRYSVPAPRSAAPSRTNPNFIHRAYGAVAHAQS